MDELIELHELIRFYKYLITKYDGDFSLSHLLECMEDRERTLFEKKIDEVE